MSATEGHRPLGRSDLLVAPLGLGTWPIGGPWTFDDRQAGWGAVDEAEAERAIRAGLDAGVSLIDTADVYGCGQSERIVGRATAGRRDQVVIATKLGLVFDESSRQGGGSDVTPAYLRRALQDSLRRLGTDHVDVVQIHGGIESAAQADDVVAAFERFVDDGLARWHGTSVTDVATIERFGRSGSAVTVEHTFNVLERDRDALAAARRSGLTSLARSPLAMGLLGGNYSTDKLPSPADVRRVTPHWSYFGADTMPLWLDRVRRVQDLLTSDGRTPAQGALAYLWGADPQVIAIPGFRTADQVLDLAAALSRGALPADVVEQVDRLLADPATPLT